MQVDNDGADIAGLSPVDLVELFQRGEAATLTGSNELSRTMANIVVVLIFGVSWLRVHRRLIGRCAWTGNYNVLFQLG